MTVKDLLIVEPYFGGSHKQLLTTLTESLQQLQSCYSYDILTLPAKKWPWKARTGALCISAQVDKSTKYKILLCSSVLSLSEIIGICPQLSTCKKIVYFHENQLVYPIRSRKDGDFQYGYNQIVTALTADIVLFNSSFNMTSFLSNINSFLKLIPDNKPCDVVKTLTPKCRVLFFPICFEPSTIKATNITPNNILHILWPHRWEHDKNPNLFFNLLFELKDNGMNFNVTILGESFSEVPEIFDTAKERLKDEIKHCGFVEDKKAYYQVIKECDVVVSTAKHEFFGVAMIEAAMSGCFPLCPNELSYPELFPSNCLYRTDRQLYKRLRTYCKHKHLAKTDYDKTQFNFTSIKWESLKREYFNVLDVPDNDASGDIKRPKLE